MPAGRGGSTIISPLPFPLPGPTGPTLPIFTETPGPPNSEGTLAAAALSQGLPRDRETATPGATATPVPAEISSLPGFASVPSRLVKRIMSKEYIDMTEMLPETWRLEMLAASGCCPHAKRPRRGMITDILVWADCYASMAAILSSAYPEKAPHLLAHFRTVVRAARNFEGVAWATYDAVCRRQAANRGSLDWGAIDNTLYSEAFTGRARVVPRCNYCLDDTHASHECSFAPVPASGNQPAAWGATSDLRRAASRPIQPTRADRRLPRTSAAYSMQICAASSIANTHTFVAVAASLTRQWTVTGPTAALGPAHHHRHHAPDGNRTGTRHACVLQ